MLLWCGRQCALRPRGTAEFASTWQAALDAALFEPGLWQPGPTKELPAHVPAPTRAHLATPAGILFNELVHSPHAVSEPVLRLVETVVELDSGRFAASSANCSAILYVLRMATRFEGFVRAVLAHANGGHGANGDKGGAKSKGAIGGVNGGASSREPARGLACSDATLSQLRTCADRLGVHLRRDMHAMVEQWCNVALAGREVGAACTLYAHLGFLYKHVEEHELDYQARTYYHY